MKTKKKVREKTNKKGQQILGLSFGVIFSIFLIIFLIVIAFIVIKEFLKIQDCTELGIFVDKLKADVKKTWNSQIDSHTFVGMLPSKIEMICFADLYGTTKGNYKNIWNELTLFEGKEANLFFYPTTKACEMPYHNIPHIDIDNIVRNQNPFCIEVINGEIKMIIQKELNDPLVNIGRV